MSTNSTLANPTPEQEIFRHHSNFEKQANHIIKKYTLITTGVCLIPLPVVDVISSTITQSLMIRELAKLYGVNDNTQLKNIALWSSVGSAVCKAIAEAVASVLNRNNEEDEERIDFTGAIIANLYTMILGSYYNLHFQNGGTLDDVSISAFGTFFIEEIKNGDLSLDAFTNPTHLIQQFTS